jgi:hypothetical protein
MITFLNIPEMNRGELIASAQLLSRVKKETVSEYGDKLQKMVALMNEKMESRADIDQLIGANNSDMMRDNHANHARFILSIMENFNAEVLVDTILWVFRAYRSRSFHTSYWAAQLNTWTTIFKAELSPETYQEVVKLYSWMQINIPSFVICSDEKLVENKSMHITD